MVRDNTDDPPWSSSLQPRQLLPWLALPDGTFFSFPGSAAIRFPAASAAAGYHGSCDDWLLFDGAGDSSDGHLLANPFSGETLRLPSLSRVRFVVGDDGATLAWRGITDDRRAPRGTTVRKLAMCPGGRVVAALVGNRRLGKIAMCRAGAGSSWVMSAHDAWRWITDIAFYDGKVYAVEGTTGDLFAMPTGEDDGRTSEPRVAWARCVVRASHGAVSARRRKQQQQQAPPSMRYLLVSGGRLMMVRRAVTADGTTRFAVFKADLVLSRWSEVWSIGADTALFVGRWCSLARRVSMYGLPGDRIHFLDDEPFSRGCSTEAFGSYDMRDGVTYPLLPTLEPCNGAGGDTPATWLFPREQEVPRWCDLPRDVLGLVLRHLRSSEDRLRLSEVCRDWCATARQHLRRRPRAHAPMVTITIPIAPAVAYLALPNGRLFRFPELTSRLPDEKSTGYAGAASDDWLLFHDNDDEGGGLRLASPFTGKTRLLPSFHGIRAHAGPVEVVNEPAPTAATRAQWRRDDKAAMSVRKLVVSPDGGFIAAIFGGEHLAKVALCSLETFSWSHSAGDRWRWYDDLALCGGTLYAVTAAGDLLAFGVGFDGDTGEPFISRVERVVEGDRGGPIAATVHYLVPSSNGGGELLRMVRRRLPYAGEEGRSRFAVFRPDLASSRWEAVSSLGRGEALFIGRLCSRAVRGQRYLPGGQIFFLPDDCPATWELRRRADHNAAVYDMFDGRVTDLLPRPRQRQNDGPGQATWLFPTTTTSGE
ncbi:unnamed protein product [Urochloa humidicola]